MASEPVTLEDDRKSAGYAIIELTDNVGFNATGAGWAYSSGTEAWRFYLFTPLIDTKGPSWIWERLLRVFTKLELPNGITPLDIAVASPEERLYRSLLVKVGGTPEGLSIVAFSNVSHLDYGIDMLWLLRSSPEASLLRAVSREKQARRFDAAVKQLLAA